MVSPLYWPLLIYVNVGHWQPELVADLLDMLINVGMHAAPDTTALAQLLPALTDLLSAEVGNMSTRDKVMFSYEEPRARPKEAVFQYGSDLCNRD